MNACFKINAKCVTLDRPGVNMKQRERTRISINFLSFC